MNRLAKIGVLSTTFFALVLGSLIQVSAAPPQGWPQNYTYEQNNDRAVEQVRHKKNHRYNHRKHRYQKQREHRSNRYCRYSPRHGTMICRPPHHRYYR